MHKAAIAFSFLVCMNYSSAQQFDFNQKCINAYNLILKLQIDTARKILNEEEIANSKNLIPVFLENYADCILITANENANDLNSLLPNKEKRLAALEKGDKTSPWFKYTQAEVNLQWALSQIKFEQYYDSFFEIKNIESTNDSKLSAFSNSSFSCLFSKLR